MWNGPHGIVNVAVKRLAAGAVKANRVKLLQEAAIMGQFLHPNVIQLFGVVAREDTVRDCATQCVQRAVLVTISVNNGTSSMAGDDCDGIGDER